MDCHNDTNGAVSSNEGQVNNHNGQVTNMNKEVNMEKKLRRLENQKIHCYNMQKYNKGDFVKHGNEFLTSYFADLCNITESIKKFYFGKSALTISYIEDSVIKNINVLGTDNIYSNLVNMKHLNIYELNETVIQPMIGQGVFMSVRGIVNKQLKFSIVFNTILIKKELHILNQYISIE